VFSNSFDYDIFGLDYYRGKGNKIMSIMRSFFTKIMSVSVCAVMAAAVLSGTALFRNNVRAAYYTPRLIVTGSEVSKDKINAGDRFDLTVHFVNESEDTHLYNIKIAFTSDDNAIYPVNGTNVCYVDSVEDEERFDVTIPMAARSDLEPKPYTLTVSYEFEDMEKMYYQDSSQIVIPVYQVPVLSVSDMKLTKNEIILDSKTSFSMKLNNTGKTGIYNVAVSVEGDTINNIDTVAGNIEKGTNTTVDLSLKGIAEGSGDINIKVTYEDADGNSYEINKTMSLTVKKQAPAELVAEEAPPFNFAYLIPVVVVIVIIIVVVNIIRKAREKKYA